jgi:hypothetical protein
MNNMSMFAISIACCISGTALIYLGDHCDSVIGITLVAIGVSCVVLGIGILRYLLFKGFHKQKRA